MMDEPLSPDAAEYLGGNSPPGAGVPPPVPSQAPAPGVVPPAIAVPIVDEATAQRQAENTVEFIGESLKASEGETSLKGMGLTDAEKLAFKNALKSFLMDTGIGNYVSSIHGYIMVPIVSSMIAVRRLFYWKKKKADGERGKDVKVKKIVVGGSVSDPSDGGVGVPPEIPGLTDLPETDEMDGVDG